MYFINLGLFAVNHISQLLKEDTIRYAFLTKSQATINRITCSFPLHWHHQFTSASGFNSGSLDRVYTISVTSYENKNESNYIKIGYVNSFTFSFSTSKSPEVKSIPYDRWCCKMKQGKVMPAVTVLSTTDMLTTRSPHRHVDN